MNKMLMIVGMLVLLLLAMIVWPTGYRYEKIEFGGIKTIVRMNRFTGNSEMLLPAGWKRMASEGDYLDRLSNENPPPKAASSTQPQPLVPEGFVLEKKR